MLGFVGISFSSVCCHNMNAGSWLTLKAFRCCPWQHEEKQRNRSIYSVGERGRFLGAEKARNHQDATPGAATEGRCLQDIDRIQTHEFDSLPWSSEYCCQPFGWWLGRRCVPENSDNNLNNIKMAIKINSIQMCLDCTRILQRGI